MAALASWRPTQGIYRFHDAMRDALWNAPLAPFRGYVVNTDSAAQDARLDPVPEV
jgi:hypothetical protein